MPTPSSDHRVVVATESGLYSHEPGREVLGPAPFPPLCGEEHVLEVDGKPAGTFPTYAEACQVGRQLAGRGRRFVVHSEVEAA